MLADLNALELTEFDGLRYAFPITGRPGSTAVYFELEPGASTGFHEDSAEEIVFVLEGAVEADVDGESATLARGMLAVIPANAPHDVRNAGGAIARMIGFFAAGTVLSSFAEAVAPEGPRQFVNGVPYAPVEAASTLRA